MIPLRSGCHISNGSGIRHDADRQELVVLLHKFVDREMGAHGTQRKVKSMDPVIFFNWGDT
jgi:hypothetical protein